MFASIPFKAPDLTDRQKIFFSAIVAVVVLCVLTCITILIALFEQPSSNIILFSEGSFISEDRKDSSINQVNPSLTTKEPFYFPVYLVGEVMNPGIYMIEKETFLFQLVELAGGFTDRAASDGVNLAYRIDENRTIRIPSVDEMSRNQEIEFTEGILVVVVPTNSMNGVNSAIPSRININTATQTQLEALPGIGPATANQIIQFRNAKGPFEKIEDIMNVPGIKASKFALLKEQITV